MRFLSLSYLYLLMLFLMQGCNITVEKIKEKEQNELKDLSYDAKKALTILHIGFKSIKIVDADKKIIVEQPLDTTFHAKSLSPKEVLPYLENYRDSIEAIDLSTPILM